MFCSKCGFDNKDDAQFCKKCGNALNIHSSIKQAHETSKKDTSSKSNNNLKIILIAVIALALILAGAFVFLSNSNNDNVSNDVVENTGGTNVETIPIILYKLKLKVLII